MSVIKCEPYKRRKAFIDYRAECLVAIAKKRMFDGYTELVQTTIAAKFRLIVISATASGTRISSWTFQVKYHADFSS